jgi:hypothetical protein
LYINGKVINSLFLLQEMEWPKDRTLKRDIYLLLLVYIYTIFVNEN